MIFLLKKNLVVVSLISYLIPVHLLAQENKKPSGSNNIDFSSVESNIKRFESPERDRWQKPDDVISLFGDLKGKTIMDLGAGSGYFTFRFAKKGAKVISADVDEGYQNYIRNKMAKQEFSDLASRIELRRINTDDPGLNEKEADGILIVNTYLV